MKAILLAGGKGTRLRPLTLKTPKPVVPIFDRPFLAYQLEALAQISEIDEVILSLNYQPDRIEDSLRDDKSFPFRIRYVVEPAPLGTAGAVRYAKQYLDDSILVFNGDVLAQLDLADVIYKHRQQKARATIVLTQINDPAAYGLVETDSEGNVKRFIEKPEPGHIASDTINAGIYVLELDTLDRIPENTNWSLERSFFPSLIKNKEKFHAYISHGYWIDIGTPEKYRQIHWDIMNRQFDVHPFRSSEIDQVVLSPSANISETVEFIGPCFVGENVTVESGAKIGPYAVINRNCKIHEGAVLEHSIIWPHTEIGSHTVLRNLIIGHACKIGNNSEPKEGTILEDESSIGDPVITF
jgi:NDP-sugar pyrophosphorylase family protein